MPDYIFYLYYQTISNIHVLKTLYRGRPDIQAVLSDMVIRLEDLSNVIDYAIKSKDTSETLMISYERVFAILDITKSMILISRKKLGKTTLFIY